MVNFVADLTGRFDREINKQINRQIYRQIHLVHISGTIQAAYKTEILRRESKCMLIGKMK